MRKSLVIPLDGMAIITLAPPLTCGRQGNGGGGIEKRADASGSPSHGRHSSRRMRAKCPGCLDGWRYADRLCTLHCQDGRPQRRNTYIDRYEGLDRGGAAVTCRQAL